MFLLLSSFGVLIAYGRCSNVLAMSMDDIPQCQIQYLYTDENSVQVLLTHSKVYVLFVDLDRYVPRVPDTKF
jgi:hypothetical protein